MKLLPREYYLSSDPVALAQDLLGKVIQVDEGGHKYLASIVETEAYKAPEDKACHAYQDRKTERTKTMFMEGGLAYMYKCYGIHDMFNIVTGPENSAHAVLIRAVAPISELAEMQSNRKMTKDHYHLLGGPGKVCQAMKMSPKHNGTKLYEFGSSIQIYEGSFDSCEVVATPRVGMSALVGEAANWPWRFYVKGSKYVSRPLRLKYDYGRTI